MTLEDDRVSRRVVALTVPLLETSPHAQFARRILQEPDARRHATRWYLMCAVTCARVCLLDQDVPIKRRN